jgi:F-type H+-transporting ATPase subunit b
MWKHLNKVVGCAVALGFFLISVALWAAEEGHEARGGHDTGSAQLVGLAFFTVNFLLFAFVLRKYALPVVKDALRKRRDSVVQALNEARRAQEEAENLRREYEQKLANLAAEQERLRTQALEAAEQQKQRIIEEARRVAERIHSEIRLVAQREVEEARRVLRQEVVEQAVRRATELLRSRLQPADQSRLVQDLVREVNNAGNGTLR